jgi:adhesin/invasin
MRHALRLAVTATVLATIGCSGFGETTEPATGSRTITKNTGDGQAARVATAVAIAPSVKVTDAGGKPLAGVTVAFSASNAGIVTLGARVTDANGIATVGSWTLGEASGTNTLTAATGGAESVQFTATGLAGPAIEMVKLTGDPVPGTAGQPVATRPSIRLRDSFQNGVPGIAVTFEVAAGGGTITGGTTTTDANGVATVGSWTLGNPGVNTLAVTAAGNGIANNPGSFTANAASSAAVIVIRRP